LLFACNLLILIQNLLMGIHPQIQTLLVLLKFVNVFINVCLYLLCFFLRFILVIYSMFGFIYVCLIFIYVCFLFFFTFWLICLWIDFLCDEL